MAKDIRCALCTKSNRLLHIGNARTALFNYLYARHHVEPLSSVSKIRTANVMSKTESVPSLKTFVGWAWTGMKVLRHTKTIVNQSVCHFTKNILINFWQKVKPISHMSLKKSWLQSANVKKRLVKLLVTLTSSLA